MGIELKNETITGLFLSLMSNLVGVKACPLKKQTRRLKSEPKTRKLKVPGETKDQKSQRKCQKKLISQNQKSGKRKSEKRQFRRNQRLRGFKS